MKDYQNALSKQISNAIDKGNTPVVFIEGGHFDPRLGPDTFSENSLKEALDFSYVLIKKFATRVRIVLGLLVDDLGLECGTETCSISDKPTPSKTTTPTALPAQLLKILEKSPVYKEPRFLIFSERTSKNRAIRTLRKELENPQTCLLQENNNGKIKLSFQMSSGENVLLAEQEGDIFRAKCPSIMGQHYTDCAQKIHGRFPDNNDLFLLDFSEMIDQSKVVAGADAACKVFLPHAPKKNIYIMNVFYIDDAGEMTMHDTHAYAPPMDCVQEVA